MGAKAELTVQDWGNNHAVRLMSHDGADLNGVKG